MEHSLTLKGTGPEIAKVLAAIMGESVGTPNKASAVDSDEAPEQYTEKELVAMDFKELKQVAIDLDIDPVGKKSAGLRKAILEAYADEEDEPEDEDDNEDEDGEDDEWEDDEEEEEEEEEEPEPPKRPRGRPRKTPAPAPAPAAAKRPRGRPRTR